MKAIYLTGNAPSEQTHTMVAIPRAQQYHNCGQPHWDGPFVSQLPPQPLFLVSSIDVLLLLLQGRPRQHLPRVLSNSQQQTSGSKGTFAKSFLTCFCMKLLFPESQISTDASPYHCFISTANQLKGECYEGATGIRMLHYHSSVGTWKYRFFWFPLLVLEVQSPWYRSLLIHLSQKATSSSWTT